MNSDLFTRAGPGVLPPGTVGRLRLQCRFVRRSKPSQQAGTRAELRRGGRGWLQVGVGTGGGRLDEASVVAGFIGRKHTHGALQKRASKTDVKLSVRMTMQ